MTRDKTARIAKPTIAEVLAQFLAEQKERLKPGTLRNYESVIELFTHSMNGYAYQYLDKIESALFDKFYDTKGDGHREFCEVFGPEKILENVPEFLDYFMVRKVMCGKALLRAAGTVTKKLAKWLEKKGYAKDVKETVEFAAEASRELPAAEELAQRLHEFAENQEWGDEGDEIEDHFTFTRVERGKVWLEGMDGRELGPVSVPEDISRHCEVGWTVSGALSRVGKSWRIVEVWNVYPG